MSANIPSHFRAGATDGDDGHCSVIKAERPCSGDPCRHGQAACPVASACQQPEEGKAPRKCRLGDIGPVHHMLLRKAPTYTFEFIVALALICLIARAFR